MSQPDLSRAEQYALQRLERELPPTLFYHSIAHTRDDVVPAALRLAQLEGLAGESVVLLHTAALFHDIGFVEKRAGHESIGVRIATEVLPRLGYSAAQIEMIAGMIMATRVPQRPRTPLECVLADADLDVLGRDDFLGRNRQLRAELASEGVIVSDRGWYSGQLRFVQRHHYWTESAQALRDAVKQRNLATLIVLLEQSARPESQVAKS
jgi:uncharacterized protein